MEDLGSLINQFAVHAAKAAVESPQGNVTIMPRECTGSVEQRCRVKSVGGDDLQHHFDWFFEV